MGREDSEEGRDCSQDVPKRRLRDGALTQLEPASDSGSPPRMLASRGLWGPHDFARRGVSALGSLSGGSVGALAPGALEGQRTSFAS